MDDLPLAYVPPDVIVTHMIASGSIEAKDVCVLKRSCASFRHFIGMNEQSIVDVSFPEAIAKSILGSQVNVPRALALSKAISEARTEDATSIASDPALFFGGPPKTFAQFDKTFTVLNHLTTLAEAVVSKGMARWNLMRWMLYVRLRYLLGILMDEAAIQAVCGADRRAFAEHVGEYCSRSIQFSMNPFDSRDDDEGDVHQLVGLAYEVWLHADQVKSSNS